ncbi:hypothetical protein SAMN05443551_0754 [Marivita hallyeonensis]|uniref:ChrR-like cupin domain-containing protein n=2 Tax=Marivita hallyeonensis TaxID=996342 RepID=A0A1M5N3D2_9RHOB|nr:hypothetical protein SAMN05443551_0754 [Marivita hallyeonensis]
MTILKTSCRSFLPMLIAVGLLAQPVSADSHVGNAAVALADAVFQPFGDTPIEIAVLNGNPQTGPSAVLLKFPPNFPGAMHTHTHGYHAVVISGGSKHWIAGQSEEDVPLQRPGDYWYQIGGEAHQDSFPTDVPTIIYVQFEGPLDVEPAE